MPLENEPKRTAVEEGFAFFHAGAHYKWKTRRGFLAKLVPRLDRGGPYINYI
jgi:hypothetical protein